MFKLYFHSLFLLILCTISLFDCHNSQDILIAVDLRNLRNGIGDDITTVSIVKEIMIGRNTYMTCLAVGCTKTALLCEKKGGKMVTNFRSINDVRQAYFKSTLVKETAILSVNCREQHIPCCFDDPNKLELISISSLTLPVVPPVASQTAPSVVPPVVSPATLSPASQTAPPVVSPATLSPASPAAPLTALQAKPLVTLPATLLAAIHAEPPTAIPAALLAALQAKPPAVILITLPATPAAASQAAPPVVPPVALPKPEPPKITLKPTKIYLFSNICLGLLGGAGQVDCNG